MTHILHAAAAAIILAAGITGTNAWGNGPDDGHTHEADAAPMEVLELAGRTVTRDELTSYADLVRMAEGRYGNDGGNLLDEFVFQHVLDDAFTTVTFNDDEVKDLKGSFRYPAERSLVRRALENDIREASVPTEAQIEDWFREYGKSYVAPERVKARHLYMGMSDDEPSSAPEKVRERLAAIRAKVEDGATTFGEAVRLHSEAASASREGDIGWVTRRMPIGPENRPMNIVLEEALFSLQPGGVSDILQTSHGLHLMFAEDRTTTFTPTIADLTTSGILPDTVQNRMASDEVRRLMAEAIKENSGKVLLTADASTTEGDVLEFDGGKYSLRDVERLYGPSLVAAVRRTDGPEEMVQLMTRVLEDIAFLHVAEQRGVHKRPDVAKQMELLRQRARMKKALEEIIVNEFATTVDDAREFYEANKDRYSKAMLAGNVLTIRADADEADRAKAQEQARAKAEEALEKLKAGADFADLAAKVSQDERATSGGEVELHLPFALQDEAARAFDMAVGQAKEGDLSEVLNMGERFVVAKLTKREMQPPPDFDTIKPDMMRMAQNEKAGKARADLMAALEAKGLVRWLPGSIMFGKRPTPGAAEVTKDGDEATTRVRAADDTRPAREGREGRRREDGRRVTAPN